MFLGKELKEIRKGKKLTQKELAASVGVSQAFISLIENNKVNPSFKVLEKMVVELQISPRKLILGKVDKKSKERRKHSK